MDETMKKYLDEAEQRLQRLEDAMLNDPAKPAKPKKTDKKENDVDKFVEFLKKTNATPEPEPGNDENFIQMMKDMNQ